MNIWSALGQILVPMGLVVVYNNPGVRLGPTASASAFALATSRASPPCRPVLFLWGRVLCGWVRFPFWVVETENGKVSISEVPYFEAHPYEGVAQTLTRGRFLNHQEGVPMRPGCRCDQKGQSSVNSWTLASSVSDLQSSWT